jgi:DNA repair exonuclease SbcCD nuclease subunit
MKIGDKVVVFTDIHLGLRNNEKRHNDECLEFIKWMIQEAHEFGATKSIFSGDWHHHRASVQTRTLSYSNQAFDLLDRSFDKHFQIVGNHDLFYKDKREIHSVEFAENYKNIKIINDIHTEGDVVLAPWLVNNEYKKIQKFTQPYIFGHFELPHFLMNALVAMPDVGHLKHDDFKTDGQSIFSGHFHKRQHQTNAHGAEIIYMGNCFPHSFSDAGDDDRGIMLLELGKKPIFKKWPGAPKFRHLLLSELIDDPAKHIDHLTTAKVTIDLDISYEEANFIKETMAQEYNVRELKLLPNKNHITNIVDTEGMVFETVDQIVTEQLKAIESTTLDKNLLIDIYNNI